MRLFNILMALAVVAVTSCGLAAAGHAKCVAIVMRADRHFLLVGAHKAGEQDKGLIFPRGSIKRKKNKNEEKNKKESKSEKDYKSESENENENENENGNESESEDEGESSGVMESARHCARRELKEETLKAGYKAKAVRLGGPFKTEGGTVKEGKKGEPSGIDHLTAYLFRLDNFETEPIRAKDQRKVVWVDQRDVRGQLSSRKEMLRLFEQAEKHLKKLDYDSMWDPMPALSLVETASQHS